MDEVRWCLDFSYAEVSRRWQDGVVVFHPLSGDTFELNELADDILCCLDGQYPRTTESLIIELIALYGATEDLLPRVRETLCQLQENRLVRVL